MTRLLHQALVIALASATFTLNTKAQEATSEKPVPKHYGWQSLRTLSVNAKLDVVTTAAPGERQHCKLKMVSVDSITCGGHTNRTLQANDIEAVITPATPTTKPGAWKTRLWFITGFGGGAYGIYLLALLGPWGAAAAGFASLVALCVLGAFSYGGVDPVPVDGRPETVIYIKPGTTYAGVYAE